MINFQNTKTEINRLRLYKTDLTIFLHDENTAGRNGILAQHQCPQLAVPDAQQEATLPWKRSVEPNTGTEHPVSLSSENDSTEAWMKKSQAVTQNLNWHFLLTSHQQNKTIWCKRWKSIRLFPAIIKHRHGQTYSSAPLSLDLALKATQSNFQRCPLLWQKLQTLSELCILQSLKSDVPEWKTEDTLASPLSPKPVLEVHICPKLRMCINT